MNFQTLLNQAIWLPIIGVIGLVFMDTVLGIMVAVLYHKFDWKKLPDWLTKIGTQVLGIAMLGVIACYQKAVWIALAPAITMLSATTLDSILKKIKDFIKEG